MSSKNHGKNRERSHIEKRRSRKKKEKEAAIMRRVRMVKRMAAEYWAGKRQDYDG
jgi:hypothetical protein